MLQNGLPSYQLKIVNGQYPFKNPQLSKIFDISVSAQLSIQPNTLHKIIQVYQSMQLQNQMLISVSGLEKVGQDITKIRYEYIDTSITKYIRQFLHQNIQIKLQKLYIELRNIANKFVLRNVNVIKALNYKNIGVNVSDIYRETMTANANNKQNKQITMPKFKVFIDLSKCEIIKKGQNLGRIVIETDKTIYSSICEQINNLVRQIQNQEHMKTKKFNKFKDYFHDGANKDTPTSIQSLECIPQGNNTSLKNIIPQNNVEQKQCGFTNNIKRRRKKNNVHTTKNGHMQINKTANENLQLQIQTKSERVNNSKKFEIAQKIYTKQINYQVNNIVERSRKTLENFKKIIKINQ